MNWKVCSNFLKDVDYKLFSGNRFYGRFMLKVLYYFDFLAVGIPTIQET